MEKGQSIKDMIKKGDTSGGMGGGVLGLFLSPSFL